MTDVAIGLTEAEARARLAAGQDNTTNTKALRSFDTARRESVFTIFNLNIVGLAAVLILLSEWWGAAMTLLMFALSATIRNLNQYRAGRRLDAVRQAIRTRAVVIRDGRHRHIDADQVVPGDLLVISSGDQFVVDGVVTGQGSMLVDTSAVTGRRGWERVQEGDEVSAGSVCLSGRGRFVAQRVGADRLIHSKLEQRSTLAARPTPLERIIAKVLGALLIVVTVYAAILLAKYFRLDVGDPIDAFVDAAPVIFSLLPTGLYLMIVVSYATGTADLARIGAVVQSARSVELLAESSLLCVTDVGLLAGTAMRAVPLPAEADDDPPEPAELHRILGDMARSTSAATPITRALAASFDGEHRPVAHESAHLAELGWVALAFDDPDDPYVYVLAEPRLVGHPSSGEDSLVLARGPISSAVPDPDGAPRLPEGLVALCLVERRRHLHPEALSVVRGFVESGVRLKVFSHEEPEAALAALREAGLAEADERQLVPRAVSRAELEALPRAGWLGLAREGRLFGGLTPDQVGELVALLRDSGERVTVVGDGLTDLPAMQEGQLSVARPASSQAALGQADIVLLSDSPKVLLRVLHRGQAIVRGLIDVMKLNLTLVLCSALLIGLVRLVGVGFPYVSAQGSIISIFAITIPSILLPIWARPTRAVAESFVSILARFVVPAGVLLGLTAFAVYLLFVSWTGSVRLAQFAVTYTLLYAGLALSVLIQPPRPRPERPGSGARRRYWRTTGLALVLGVVVLLVPLVPLGRRQFRLELLPDAGSYLVVLLAVAGWLALLHLWWRRVPRVDLD